MYFLSDVIVMETMLTEFKFKQEEQRDQIRNHIANIKSKLSSAFLDIKIGVLKEWAEQSMKTYEQVQEHLNTTSGPLANITNQTLNSMNMSSAKVSRTDDGAYMNFFNFVQFSFGFLLAILYIPWFWFSILTK